MKRTTGGGKTARNLMLVVALAANTVNHAIAQEKLPGILKEELNREMKAYGASAVPAYYLSLRVEDFKEDKIETSFGALITSKEEHSRVLTPMIRVGDYKLDNYHNGQNQSISKGFMGGGLEVFNLPFDDNEASIRQMIWNATNARYMNAVTLLGNIKAKNGVAAGSEDKSDDFSSIKPEKYYEPVLTVQQQRFDRKYWEERLKRYSALFLKDKYILEGKAVIQFRKIRKYFVDSDGSEVAENNISARIMISAMTKADDGMELPLFKDYFAFSPDSLPGDEKIMEDIDAMIVKLGKLRVAPIVQPYTGPAILLGGAAGVFFHEIFGHRVEGLRIKKDSDGQTFKKKVGQFVLPEALSVYLDPSLKQIDGQDLNGYYAFDDQGVRGQRVTVVDHGIFRNFAMTRTPLDGFPVSNGHARAEAGLDVTSRQSNLIVENSDYKTDKELRELLIKEAVAQKKEYGFVFAAVSGGFTITDRSEQPNAFNVSPLEVYKVYVDGRPDELVRGVDLIGTPLSMFSHIVYAGGKSEVFTGYCGAESGWVPVTACSPEILVSQVEMQSKPKFNDLPPVLDRPVVTQQKNDMPFTVMQQELDRNMSRLSLPGKQRPFFMQYYLVEGKLLILKASLGSIIDRKDWPMSRALGAVVLVGDYKKTNLTNYPLSRFEDDPPTAIDDNYDQVKRDLWKLTDKEYKAAVEEFNKKVAKGSEDNDDPDSAADDLLRVKPVISISPLVAAPVHEDRLEKLSKELSSVFLEYKDIERSELTMRYAANKLYCVNSEGSKFSYPNSQLVITVLAEVRAADGQEIKNSLEVCVSKEEDLGSPDSLKEKVRSFAREMVALQHSGPMKDFYSGPVLFEGKAAESVFINDLFTKDGLSAARGQEQPFSLSLQDRMGSKVMAKEFSVMARPAMKEYNGEKLVGAYGLDADGITPAPALTLVDNGILKNVLGGRMATPYYSSPSGSFRSGAHPRQAQMIVAPGVAEITTSKGMPASRLKELLIEKARENGSDYAYIVRDMTHTAFFVLKYYPVVLVRVNVKDGSEEMMHGAELTDFREGLLKQVLGASDRQQVINTSFDMIPLTYITPDAVLLPELEISPRKNAEKTPAPIGSNPAIGRY